MKGSCINWYHCWMVAVVFHVAVGTGRVFHWFVALVSVHH